MSVVTIERKVLEKNDTLAAANRERFARHGLLVVNLVSSPGAGKTTLLEATIEELRDRARIAVVEGDVQTDLDAQRVASYGVPVVQIVTNGGCHLEANLVADAVDRLDLDQVDLLVIENVGNLVCPANFDLGETMKVVVLSTTEGADKPLKYPAMFRKAAALIINKVDLLPYVNVSVSDIKRHARHINPHLAIFETAATSRFGVAEWCDWLIARLAAGHA
jgi:hydrogenase nickel incorporation protein HypB